jgi:hypothetical protein
MLLWRIHVVGNHKTYLGLRVKCPIFWSDVTIFGIYRQAVVKVTDIIIHRFGSSSSWYKRTDRYDVGQRRFSRISERAENEKCRW